MSHAVLATASASPTSTPSNRFPATMATAVTTSTTASPRCSRHSTPNSLTGTSLHPACTSSPASAATGSTPSTPGSTAVKTSSHTPCSTRDTFVRAPACTFAALRTITAVIGSAPSTPHTAFPAPCAISSRS
jgi:hypothetical protein